MNRWREWRADNRNRASTELRPTSPRVASGSSLLQFLSVEDVSSASVDRSGVNGGRWRDRHREFPG